MRRMRKVLQDNKEYVFQTLSRLHLSNYQTIFSDKNARKLESLQKTLDSGGEITEEEYDLLVELQKQRMRKVNDLIRISLSTVQPEFKLTKDETKEEELNTKLELLLDMRDTAQIVEFITTGTVTQVKETFVKEEEIVL